METGKLLIDEPPLQILPSLARLIGLNEAIVVQQIHYWIRRSKHEHEGRRWVYNTYDEWAKQFDFWSIPTIKRIFKKLKEMGLLLEGNFNEKKFDRTLWYSIDYERISNLKDSRNGRMDDTETADREDQIDTMDGVKMTSPIPLDYTETNKEDTATNNTARARVCSQRYTQDANMSLLEPNGIPLTKVQKTYFTTIQKLCNAIYHSFFKSAMPCSKEMPAQLQRTADHFERELGPDDKPLDTPGALRLLAVAFEAFCFYHGWEGMSKEEARADKILKYKHSFGCFAAEIPRWVQEARGNPDVFMPLEEPADVLKLNYRDSRSQRRAEAYAKRNPNNRDSIFTLISKATEGLTYEQYKQEAAATAVD